MDISGLKFGLSVKVLTAITDQISAEVRQNYKQRLKIFDHTVYATL